MSNRNYSGPFIFSVAKEDVDFKVARFLGDGGVRFDLREITDAVSFFREVIESLPLNPPLSGNKSWDAMNDSLSAGLDELDSAKVAIVWHEAATMRGREPRDYEIAIDVLMQICCDLLREDLCMTRPKVVQVYLAN